MPPEFRQRKQLRYDESDILCYHLEKESYQPSQ
jgi:hypothetical protein